MFLIRLLRWLRGSVTFWVTGAFPERLINLCLRHKLPVWGVRPRPGGCEASTYAGQYKKIRPLARAANTRVRLRRKNGWPFLRRRYRRRWGLALGLTLAAVLLLLLSTRVWSIELYGCEEIEQQQLLASLDELGLRLGVSARSVDARTLERQLLLRDGRISWVAVNIQGSRASIELKERVAPPQRIDPKTGACNIIAAADGQIKYLEIYEGQPMVKVGDTVMKGDIIVSGVTEDKHGNTALKYARAKVVAQVYDELEVVEPLEQTALRPAGESYAVRRLELFGLELALTPPRVAEEEALHEESSHAELFGLPQLTLVTTHMTPMERYGFTLTPFEAKERAMRRLTLAEQALLEHCTVLTREVHGSGSDKAFTLTASYLLERDIARASEIVTE